MLYIKWLITSLLIKCSLFYILKDGAIFGRDPPARFLSVYLDKGISQRG